ncbi:MAG: hypothetical protein RIT43_1109 [Bacteroidota bacterium]
MLLILFHSVLKGQIETGKADSLILDYLSSKSWSERSKYVLVNENTLELMEERYGELNFNNLHSDSTSSLNKLKKAFTSNKDPWIKVKGYNNYYKKKTVYYLKNNFGADVKQVSTYYVVLKNNSLLLDWEASVGFSELSMKAFDIKKPSKYYFMRVQMELCESFYDKDYLPDYFCVQIKQDGEIFSEKAIVSKSSENGLALYEQLSDGKSHSKVIWLRYVNLMNRDESNTYQPTVENLRIIGYVNSIDSDSWIISESENDIVNKVCVEDKNLQIDIEKYNSYIKNKSLIESASPNLKTINSAKTEFFDKQINVFGYLKLDDYYNWGYSKSQETHYSFKLYDGTQTVQVYFPKSSSKEIFDLLKTTNKLAVKITGIAYKRYQEDNFGDILIEGIKYEILK